MVRSKPEAACSRVMVSVTDMSRPRVRGRPAPEARPPKKSEKRSAMSKPPPKKSSMPPMPPKPDGPLGSP